LLINSWSGDIEFDHDKILLYNNKTNFCNQVERSSYLRIKG